MIEKAGNAEVNANLQPPFYVRDINARCLKGHRSLTKKDKEDIYQELCDMASNKDKAKSNSSASANQPQTQGLKKDKHGCRGGHPATRVNTTEVVKKDKAPKELSHIEYYTCHQKGQYAIKCPDKPIN